jgi:excisionase family DNA binding protein
MKDITRKFRDHVIFDGKEYFSCHAIAYLTGLHRDTIQKKARKGTISAVRIGGAFFFDRDTVISQLSPKPVENRVDTFELPDGV